MSDGLIPHGARPELLESGFGFLEGPVWDRRRDALLFSDIPGDTRYRWSPSEGLAVDARPTNKANGLAFDREGRLLVCEHASSTLSRIEADGSRSVLAESFEGAALNGPNDVVVRSDGLIVFTDPPYARLHPEHGVPRPRELDHCGVYALAADGDLRLLAADFEAPNGLCFGLDEATLHVNDSERRHVRRFVIADDGGLDGGEVIYVQEDDGGNPDGMKLDEHGNLWLTAPGGVRVLDPDGRPIGVLEVPEGVANLAWGEGTTLFLCATTSLYRVETSVRSATATRR